MHKVIIPESFPNLPSAIQKIQQLFLHDSDDVSILVTLLEEEPLLCANILKLVNSSHYGLTHKVTSIKHAVMMLGATIIRGIIMATLLKKSFPLNLSPYNITIEFFDEICIYRVRLLNEWLKKTDIDIKTLASVAFLMEIGKIVTANEIMKHNLCDNFIELTHTHPIEEAERTLFLIQSYEIASLLFTQWQFDTHFSELIKNVLSPQNDEQKILHVLSVAINITGILSQENIDKATQLVIEYGFDTQAFMNAINLIKKDKE